MKDYDKKSGMASLFLKLPYPSPYHFTQIQIHDKFKKRTF